MQCRLPSLSLPLALAMALVWPASALLTTMLGRPQPNWTTRPDNGILLAVLDAQRAVLLYSGEVEYVHPRFTFSELAQRPERVGAFTMFELWPLSLMGVVLTAYLLAVPRLRRTRRTALAKVFIQFELHAVFSLGIST